MEILTALGVLCVLPLFIFWLGWTSCYLLVVKYRFRVERRWETQEYQPARRQEAEWQP